MQNTITSSFTLEQVESYVKKELKRGANDDKHPYHTLVLSTCKMEAVKARYVVLRNFDPHSWAIAIYTDKRSSKVAELRGDPNAHLLFWNPKRKLQIGIQAKAEVWDEEKSNEVWTNYQGRPDDFIHQLAPGLQIDSIKAGQQLDSGVGGEHFTGISFIPAAMDVLQLNKEGHIRAELLLENGKVVKASWLAP